MRVVCLISQSSLPLFEYLAPLVPELSKQAEVRVMIRADKHQPQADSSLDVYSEAIRRCIDDQVLGTGQPLPPCEILIRAEWGSVPAASTPAPIFRVGLFHGVSHKIGALRDCLLSDEDLIILCSHRQQQWAQSNGFGHKQCWVGGLIKLSVAQQEGDFAKIYDTGYLHRLTHRSEAYDKTVIYAPTWYPSSLMNMPEDWVDRLASHRILMKPHHRLFTVDDYRKESERMHRWAERKHVTLIPSYLPLLPFMQLGDAMISDVSSAGLEFAALNKPLYSTLFLKWRLGYSGLLYWRRNRRLDLPTLQRKQVGRVYRSAKDFSEHIAADVRHWNGYSAKEVANIREAVPAYDPSTMHPRVLAQVIMDRYRSWCEQRR